MKRTLYGLFLLSILVGLATSAYGATASSAIAPSSTAQGFEGINIGAGLAIGLAAVGAGLAVGMAAAAGIGVLTERRDMFGTVLIFVAIGEGIVVYGLVFAVLMLFAHV
ncbi:MULTISPECIES: ATP synthase subunit K [Acidianus]|uniref:ATP synthase subunit K n=1 Tax=Candidatus Acidianus copahuensis TaxID=1160895 RepID=A0A031LPJ4_9CREN|nr:MULTISPECIES: ATP synthase subunit K [Acidianus]EZQ07002.1 ATP synthase subunit K [Candidatus Acidianus copahuensis]NON61160.1 V-type ATP synthase subunit K [Acidianus sp. RZ1]